MPSRDSPIFGVIGALSRNLLWTLDANMTFNFPCPNTGTKFRAGPAGHSGRRSQSVAGKGTKGIQSLANCFVTQGKDKWILPVPPLLYLTFSEGFRGSTSTNDGLNESSNSCHHDSGVKNTCLGGVPNSNRALNRHTQLYMSIYTYIIIRQVPLLEDRMLVLFAMRLRRENTIPVFFAAFRQNKTH